MDCVNHPGTNANAYCQNCGKPLCTSCTRAGAPGQVVCEPCWTAWQSFQPPVGIPPMASGPNPSAAAVLGLIPGVGAMYNGQFFKGLIHVVIFAVLVSITSNVHGPMDGFFGIMIGAWVIYQSFEAFHTAKALREGNPAPDPLGLNEVGLWLHIGTNRPQTPGQPSAGQQQGYQPWGQSSYQPPYPPPPVNPGGPIPPPIPPPGLECAPFGWRRKEPIGAIVLIGLGLLFLLDQIDLFHGEVMRFAWPLLLIGLGVWLVIRRMGGTEGGQK